MKASSWFQLIQNCKGLKFSTFYTVYVSHNKQLSRYFLMFFVTSHHWIAQSHQMVRIMPQGLYGPCVSLGAGLVGYLGKCASLSQRSAQRGTE